MEDTAFADATRPTPVCVLKLPLRPYSLGHELLLLRSRSPFLLKSDGEFNALPQTEQMESLYLAVNRCACTWLENNSPPPLRLHPRVLAFRRCLLGADDYRLAIAEFWNYLADGRQIPRLSKRRLKSGEEPGRPFGAPLLAQLYQFVLTLPEIQNQNADQRIAATWDFPFGAAVWRYFVHLEIKGDAQIENDDELESRLKTAKIQREYEAAQAAAAKLSTLDPRPSTKEPTCPA